MNSMRARAKLLHPDLSKFDDYLTGSNYVPFDDAMLTQYILVDHSPCIRVVLDDHRSGNNTKPAQYDCSINWPSNIYVCQIMDKERLGTSFVIIPEFNTNKIYMNFLWLTCNILCNCK